MSSLKSYICLILKKMDAKSVREYKPISLTSWFYWKDPIGKIEKGVILYK